MHSSQCDWCMQFIDTVHCKRKDDDENMCVYMYGALNYVILLLLVMAQASVAKSLMLLLVSR